MQESGCNSCRCDLAVFDDSGHQVRIYGSFCSPIRGSMMIEITAYSLDTGEEIWNDICDTGRMCTIPFELLHEWQCYNSEEEE